MPEGDNEAHVDGSITFESDAPCVKYHSTSHADNKRRCVLDNAASGLHFLGFHRLRVMVAAKANSQTRIPNPMGNLQDLFENNLNKAEAKKVEFVSLGAKWCKAWKALLSPKDYVMCVLGIRSSDGKTDHAICIADGWIFDSNFEKALPLSEESLNLCSSSSERATNFVEVTRGVMLGKRG
jgi:hypothetical protein